MTDELTENTANHLIDKAANFIDQIVGPSFRQLGGILDDRVKIWRLKIQVSIVEKAEKYFLDKGLKPQTVPLKILFPLLEHGSLEEDEDLQDKWASLLINAANLDGSQDFSILYIEILRQLSPVEVKVLDKIYMKYLERTADMRPNVYNDIPIDRFLFKSLFDLTTKSNREIIETNFKRLNIIQYILDDIKVKDTEYRDYDTHEVERVSYYYFTALGVSFLEACYQIKDDNGDSS